MSLLWVNLWIHEFKNSRQQQPVNSEVPFVSHLSFTGKTHFLHCQVFLYQFHRFFFVGVTTRRPSPQGKVDTCGDLIRMSHSHSPSLPRREEPDQRIQLKERSTP